MNSAIFIDKDGTLVDNSIYPKIPTDDILNQVTDGLKYIKEKGFKIIIISNQPWISKGLATPEEVESIFRTLILKLKQKNIEIDDYLYCPHQSSDNCLCKKPKHKMIFDAAIKHQISLSSSYVVGDMDKDMDLGKNCGLKTILVKTGCGLQFLDSNPDFIIENLNEITKIL